MRALPLSVALVASIATTDVLAASTAVIIELGDDHPIGVRVYLAPTLACVDLGAPIAEALVSKGKPIIINSDALGFCVAQTTWPQTSSGYGTLVLVTHVAGTPPLQLRVRGKPGDPTTVPAVAMPPLVVSVAGKERVGLHLAAKVGKNCDLSSSSMRLFSGILEPGKPITFATDAACVCYEQTSAPFVNVGWSSPRTYCRAATCVGKYCTPSSTAPFALAVPSRLP